MFIAGVTVCIDYDDFLAETLPRNLDFFDTLIVVTSEEDDATQSLVRRLNKGDGVSVITTDRNKLQGAEFNKGAAINEGLQFAKLGTEWLVHLDADVILPPGLRERLEQTKLDPSCIYGIHRRMCESYKDWKQAQDWQLMLKENDPIPTSQFPLEGKRRNGNPPPGFFQMWHSSANRYYPEQYSTATTSDLEFGKLWHPNNRIFLDEYCIHLATTPQARWTNWRGRTSPRWGEQS